MKKIFNYIIGSIVLVILVAALFSIGTIVIGVFTVLCIIAGFVKLFKSKNKIVYAKIIK